MGIIKWIVLLIVSGLLVLMLLMALLDWNWVRDYAARKLSDLTGRTVTIEGNLDVDWSRAPRIHAERIRFENASWSQEPYLLQLEALDVRIDLVALITGRIVLPEVHLVQPQVHLEVSPTGHPNWVFRDNPEPVSKTHPTLPVIHRLRIEEGHVAYRDPSTDTDMTTTVATLRENSGEETLQVQGQGTIQRRSLAFNLQVGTWVDSPDADKLYPVTMQAQVGNTQAQIEGTLEQPLQLQGLNLAVEVQGADAELVEAFAGTTLSGLLPYHLQARLSRDHAEWKFSALQVKVGNSDVTGDATLAVQNPRPVLRATFSSKTLDVTQLMAALPSGSASDSPDVAKGAPKAIADEMPIRVDALQMMDAEVTLQARQVLTPAVKMDDVALHMTLNKGRLRIEPLQIGIGAGALTSHLDLDARAPLIQASLHVQIDHVNLGQVLGDTYTKNIPPGMMNGILKASLAQPQTEAAFLSLSSLLQRLQVDTDHLTYRDEAAGTDLQATIRTVMSDAGPTLNLEAKGSYHGQAVTLRTTVSDVAQVANPAAPTALETEVGLSGTQIRLQTRLDNALTLEGLHTDISIQGGSLSDVEPLLGMSLPDLADYRISGRLERVGTTWKLHDVKAKAGNSDVSGNIAVETAAKRPRLRVDLVADTLDLQQLLERLDGRSHDAASAAMQTAASRPERSGKTLNVEPLRAMDAVIALRAKHLIVPQLRLENVALHADLQDGKLRIEPLTLEVQGEQIALTAEMDATQSPLYAIIHTTFQRLNLDPLLSSLKLADGPLGVLGGQLNIRAVIADAASAGATPVLPFVTGLDIDNSQLSYRNPPQGIEVRAELHTEKVKASKPELHIKAQGHYREEDFQLQFRGDSLFALHEPNTPYRLDATVKAVQTEARIQARLSRPFKLSGIDSRLEIEGANPEQLSTLLGFPLPKLPPYHIKGDLSQQADAWIFQKFEGRVGDSDLAGDIRLDTGGDRPLIKADLTSRKIDFDDLGPLINKAPSTGPGETASPGQQQEMKREEVSPTALPDDPIDFKNLRRLDAEITLKGKRIESKLPLDDLNLKVLIHDGQLTMKPLDFGVANGNVQSHLELNAGSQPVKVNVATEIRRVKLNEIVRHFKIADESVGLIGGRVKVWLEGDTIAKMLASADGGALLLMTGGRLDHLLVELAGLDIGEALPSLFGNRKNVEINCAFLDLPTKRGVMKLDTLVVDTDDTVFLGAGTLDFKTEQMELVIDPNPKDLSLFSARAPLHIEGRFKDPSFRPEASAIARGALSIAMLPTVPIAALVSLLTEEDNKDSPYCAGLIDAINKVR